MFSENYFSRQQILQTTSFEEGQIYGAQRRVFLCTFLVQLRLNRRPYVKGQH
jgi:hypothetical protein